MQDVLPLDAGAARGGIEDTQVDLHMLTRSRPNLSVNTVAPAARLRLKDGKIFFAQFLEDTFGTSGTLGRPRT